MSLDDEVVYHPDMKDNDAANGLVCFLSHDRPCGADCMAFTMEKLDGQEYLGQWANCRVLVGLHKGAKHLTILAQVGGQLVKHQADTTRRSQSAPPMPRGPQT